MNISDREDKLYNQIMTLKASDDFSDRDAAFEMIGILGNESLNITLAERLDIIERKLNEHYVRKHSDNKDFNSMSPKEQIIDKSFDGELQDENYAEDSEVDPFSSLNQMLGGNPEFKKTFDSLMGILGDDSPNEEETPTEVECIEIDGHDYIIAKTIEIAGNTYLLLINGDDVMDYLIQRVIVEDGEEYISSLDSEKEFDLVMAYLQRDMLTQVKEKLHKDTADTTEDQ